MMEGTMPVPPAAPAPGVIMRYFLFWNYHDQENPDSWGETPVRVQVFFRFLQS
jgi:hypothetical protein